MLFILILDRMSHDTAISNPEQIVADSCSIPMNPGLRILTVL
jgi:hypothetical protein